ncbi:MAG: O-antigen ligase family protein [Ferruginibacter sp.]
MSIFKILAYLNIILFLLVMLFVKGNKKRLYIQFILISYPILAIYISPYMDGFDAITWIFALIFYRRKKISFPSGFIYIVLFFALLGITLAGALVTNTVELPDFIPSFVNMLSVFMFAKILIDECIEDHTFFYTVLSFFKTALIICLLFLCCQFVLGVDFTLSKSQNNNILITDAIRYPSIFSDPQVCSAFLSILSFLCLIKDYRDDKMPMKNYILATLAVIAILSTGGRAGLLGWALGLFLVAMFGNSKYRVTVIVTSLALYLVAYNFQDSFSIFKRSGDMEETYEFRYAIWKDAFQIFLQHPFFGIGMGNYSHYVSIHNPDQFWDLDGEVVYFDHPESGYLKFLTEMGGAGFVMIFSLILAPVFRGFVTYIKTRDTSIILMIACIMSWMVGFWSNYSFADSRVKILIVTIVCLLITSGNRIEAEKAAMQEITDDDE